MRSSAQAPATTPSSQASGCSGWKATCPGRTASGDAFDVPPFNTARQSGTKERWLATARIRLGAAPIEHWLAYITGGVALADVEAEIINPEATYTERHVRGGWTAGAGVEYAMTGNWSAKLEYLHVGLTDTSYFTPAPAATTSIVVRVCRSMKTSCAPG